MVAVSAEDLVVADSSKNTNVAWIMHDDTDARARTTTTPVSQAARFPYHGRASLGPPRQTNATALGSLAVALFVATSGCTAIAPKLAAVPKPHASSQQSATLSRNPQPLGDPENQSLQIALETARLAEERSMDAEAIAAYEKARRIAPKHPGIAHALAVLYDRAAMTDSAQREYSAALEESPEDPDVLCDYGYFLYSTGKLEEAEQTLRRGIAVDANHQKTLVNLAVVLATRRQYSEAKPLFEKAIGPAAALHNIGMFKLRQGESAEGERMIAAALEKDPSLGQSRSVLENVSASVARPYLASRVEGSQQ
nr:tetratricopeptide repeat protein [Rhodopirellula sp. JC639]